METSRSAVEVDKSAWPRGVDSLRQSCSAVKLARTPLLLAAALLLGCALAACGSGAGDVVARVGGSSIARSDLDHWASVATGSSQAGQRRVLSFLISAQWLLDEAAELHVKVNDAEAQRQLELFAYDQREGVPYEGLSARPELTKFLARAKDPSDRLWLMKLGHLALRVKQRQLANAEHKITATEIAAFYEKHKALFLLPERRDVTWIVVYSEAVLQKALREVRAGKSLLAVASRVSLDSPTITGFEPHPAVEKKLARHVFATRPHVLAGPFRQGVNHYVFEVTRVVPARIQTLAPTEASIRQRLAAQSVSMVLPAVLSRKWASRTVCVSGLVVPQCAGPPRPTA